MIDVHERHLMLRQHLAAAGRSAGRRFAQAAFTLVVLPYEAFFSLDAILRAAVRLLITQRRLLEWSPSGDPDRTSRTDLAGLYRSMWIAPVVATAAGIYLTLSRPPALAVAGPLLGLWFAAPAIAWWISRPLAPRKPRLTADQAVFLQKLSRRTWAFFETFVGPDDHYLPPDNYQEEPGNKVAHRTSPTNIGLYLLSSLTAHDLGYLTAAGLADAACGGKGRSGEGHAACAKKCIEKGGDIVLVTDENKVIKVHNPDSVKSKAGEKVTVSGKLDGDEIHVESVK